MKPDKKFIPDAEILKWKYDQQVKYEAKVMTIMRKLDDQLKNLEDYLDFSFDSAIAIGGHSDGSLYKIIIKKEHITNQL